jgi:hypothetical protein
MQPVVEGPVVIGLETLASRVSYEVPCRRLGLVSPVGAARAAVTHRAQRSAAFASLGMIWHFVANRSTQRDEA